MLEVDGSQGEGGGQILRMALALSAIREIPVEVHSIRARRKTPGVQAQHLTALRALAEVCGARVDGASIGSQRLTFVPGPVRAGEYRLDVGTAGSTLLVLQAVLFPLALAPTASRITLTGGTHVPWSPSAHYVQEVLLPVLAELGVRARLKLERWGFYPRGGGRILVEVEAAASLRPLTMVVRTGGLRIRGISAVANLSRRIAERQRDRALRRLEAEGLTADIALIEAEAASPGSFLILVAESGGLPAGFSALGERGKPAERVADEAVNGLLEFAKSDAVCDPWLADQLILPMALAPGSSRFTTSRITRHLGTTVQLAQQILGCPAQIGGEEGSPGSVTIQGVGWRVESREPRPPGGTRPGPRYEDEVGTGPGQTWRAETSSGLGTGAPRGGEEPVQETGSHATSLRQSESRNPTSEIELSRVVRKARAADVPAIQTLVAHFAAKGDLLPRTLNDLYQHLRDFFVCEVGGEIAGICALSLYWEDLAEVRSLAVQEAHAGKGLGAALVTACLEEAANLGVGRVFALTYRPGFFERLGFQVIDKRELPQKIWKDCIKCAKFTCCDEVALIRKT